MANYDGMNGDFTNRLQQLVAASGGRITLTSGFRSPEKQKALWAAALAKYGDPEVADNWVARPGTSHHEKGIAADLHFADASAREWAHANAARFGLHFPMSWEPWHIEPTGAAKVADPAAYTTPPTGFENPAVVQEDPHDVGVQFGRLMGAMLGTNEGQFDTPGQEAVQAPTMDQPGQIEQQLTQASGAAGGN